MIKRKEILEKSFFVKLLRIIQNYLISFQLIMLSGNFSANLKNLYWVKFLITVNSIQEIQLVDGNRMFLQEIFKKFQLNSLFYSRDQRFVIFAYIVLTSLLIFIGLIPILQHFKIQIHLVIGSYVILSVFYLLIMPSFINTIYLILEREMYFHLILFLICLIFNIIYILYNKQKCLQQLEGTYSKTNQEFFSFLFRLLMIIIKIKCPNQTVQFSISLFKSSVMLLMFSTVTDASSEFIVEAQIVLFVFSLAGLSSLSWIEIMLLYPFLRFLIQTIFQRIYSKFLFSKTNVHHIQEIIQTIIYYNNKDETLKTILATSVFNQNQKGLQKNISQINIVKRIRIEQYFEKNTYKLFIISLQYLQNFRSSYNNTVFVKAYMLHLKQRYFCQKSKFDQLFQLVRVLETEKQNYEIFSEIQMARKSLLQVLMKNSSDQNYIKKIESSMIEYCSNLQDLKRRFFESNLLQKNISQAIIEKINFKTAIALQLFYCIFYLDYQKAIELGRRAKLKMQLDIQINSKLEKNTILLFKVSQFQNNGSILNKESKNLQDFFQEDFPNSFLQLIPEHQQIAYESALQSYISGENKANSFQIFLLKQNYSYQCQMNIFSQFTSNDLIFNQLINVSENCDFILFDMSGKIIGIADQLFLYLNDLSKGQDDENATIPVKFFLDQAMIQYYIPDINQLVKELLLDTKKQSCQFSSAFFLDLNHNDCLLNKVNFSICEDKGKNLKFQQPLIIDNAYNSQFDEFNTNLKQFNQNDFKFYLEFHENDPTKSYFLLKFLDFKSAWKAQTMLIEDREQTEICHTSNPMIEQIIDKNHISKNLRVQLVLIACFTLYSLLTVILNNYNEQSEIVSFQKSINFLINPQALTFSYAGSYLLQWNRYCVESGLYNLTPYVEFQRQAKLNYAFTLWKSIHVNYTINLSRRGDILGIPNVEVESFDNSNNKIIEIMPLYNFYTITREKMVRIYKNTNFTKISTHDYSIFKGNGYLRQNILKIFKFHDVVIDDEFNSLNSRILYSQTQFQLIQIIQIFGSFVFIISLLISVFYYIKLLNLITKLLQCIDLSHLKNQVFQIQSINQAINNTGQSITNVYGQETLRYDNQNQEKQKITNTPTKLQFSKIKLTSKLRLIFPLILVLFYCSEAIGAAIIRENYYDKYKNSLLMTMNYIKFKKLFDSSILLGELIKTEHLIPSNPFYLINQSDTISSYLMYVDNSTNLFNKILDDLIVSNYFNQTMKDLIIQAFGQDLCLNFKKFLVFCNTTQIKLPYKETDSYLSITQDGVAGVIRNYYKMVQQEYSYERSYLQYSQNITNIKSFINSQIHQNYFVQYAQDIQSCLFTCFSYFINESVYLSSSFIEIMNEYFTITGTMLLFILLTLNIYWIYSQYTKLHKIKYILTLIGPDVSQKKSVIQILQKIQNQI